MRSWLALVVALAGCDPQASDVDAGSGRGDAGSVVTRDAGGVDAGALADAAPRDTDAGSVDAAGRVPVFVAYGHSARTLTSCDGGETWIAEHSFEPDGHDHSPYSGLGRMAYGDGRFIGCAGWGEPVRIVWSDNGVDWAELGDDAFLTETGQPGRPIGGCAGIGFDGTVFAFISRNRLYTSPDGMVWTRQPERVPGSNIRAVGGGEGLLLFTGGSAYISDDHGATWFVGEGYDDACSGGVQRGGGILVDGDRVLIGGRDGVMCASADRGRTFASTALEGGVRGLAFDGAGYLAASNGPVIRRSPDGLVWTSLSHDVPTNLAAVAFAPPFGFVAVARDGQRFFRSADGATWTESISEGVDDDYLWTIVFGLATASARCPAP